jgi:hypothetical protein
MTTGSPAVDALRTVVGVTAPLARARGWLRSPAIVDASGAVCSWANPRHPGFDYPEAAGLWLCAFAGRGTPRDELADRVAARLAERMLAGEVGRDGVTYTFDLGVALAGLIDHRRANGRAHPQARATGEAELLAALAQRRAASAGREPRWSTRYGPHLLKLAAVLARMPGPAPRAGTARLFDDLADLRDGGRFVTSDAGATYVHAHCYAAEGLWCIAHTDTDPARRRASAHRLAAAADFLADVQRADGALPSDHDGARAHGPGRADATAQAIRIWTAVDSRRHAAAIAGAQRWLDSCTTSEGAVRYEAGSDDLNAWATIFALQAADMVAGASAAELPW